ncbi:MAG: amidohydrolase family protein [Actinomycetota bacterium]|jgi:cytosine deaminase
MLLRSATLADGRVVDIRICLDTIDAVSSSLIAQPDEQILDLSGHLLLPAFAEPHAHLDKAFLSERFANDAGDLMGAIVAMQQNRHLITYEDTVDRAERAVRLMVRNGASAIRTHADTTAENGLMSVEALAEVRRRTADICDIQIVSLVGWPVTGPQGADSRALLRDALQIGADLVGGCPHLDDDPEGANETLLEIADEYKRGVDLHTDENLDPRKNGLEDLARRVLSSGFEHSVTASHCVSLGSQTPHRQDEIAELVAAANISVVALPHTNLFLQGREHQQSMPRAITAVKALRARGVNVCAGADNLQDPFNPMGRGDPLETASLMVMLAHLLPHQGLEVVSANARRALALPPLQIEPGSVADLVAVKVESVREAIAFGPPERIVLHRGVVVSPMPHR